MNKRSIIWNPTFISEYFLRRTLEKVFSDVSFSGKRCLDVGCGDRQYEDFFQEGEYIGIDVETSGRDTELKKPDLFYDGVSIPFDDDRFDYVICTQVLEHVQNPRSLLTEMVRARCQYLHIRAFCFPEHETPYDFFRYTEFGCKTMLTDVGLTPKTIIKDTGPIETVATLINLYVVSSFSFSVPGARRLLAIFFCSPVSLITILLAKILPNDGSLYLNLVIRAKK